MSATDVIYFWADLNLNICVLLTVEFHRSKPARYNPKLSLRRVRIRFVPSSLTRGPALRNGPRFLGERRKLSCETPVLWEGTRTFSARLSFLGIPNHLKWAAGGVTAVAHSQRMFISHMARKRRRCSPAKLNTTTAVSCWEQLLFLICICFYMLKLTFQFVRLLSLSSQVSQHRCLFQKEFKAHNDWA